MNEAEATRQLDRLELRNKKAIPKRARRLILQAVASENPQVVFRGIYVDLESTAGIRAAVNLLTRHPCSWMESVPDVLAEPEKSPIGSISPKPRFGL